MSTLAVLVVASSDAPVASLEGNARLAMEGNARVKAEGLAVGEIRHRGSEPVAVGIVAHRFEAEFPDV